ncbi:MAG: THUMP domain-containing protein [Candidatus Micrarchaeota archaeon]|nr:THUMP domain-containing protein [Candidatus Micrarchaeota archaeon]
MKLIAKYAESLLKGPKERKRLEKILRENIVSAFPGIEASIENGVIRVDSEKDISKELSNVFGVHTVYNCFESKTDMDSIAGVILANADKAKKYKIEVKRKNKEYPLNSIKIAQKLSEMLFYKGLQMSVKNPDDTIYVEIGHKNAECLFNRKEGVAGLPYGSSGNILMMFSGGIDSPVASYLLARRGLSIDALYIGTPIMKSQVKSIWDSLCNNFHIKGNFYFVDNSKIMEELSSFGNEFRQIGLKAAFYLVSCKIADEKKIDVIATGESIGQVSTQTLGNISLLDGLSTKTVLRPLIGMTKDDIIAIARRIGTIDKSECLPEMCKVSSRPRVKIRKDLFLRIARRMDEVTSNECETV